VISVMSLGVIFGCRYMSDQAVFPYRTGLSKDAQNTVTLGMVYAFSSANVK
jgi:hypothetical protein